MYKNQLQELAQRSCFNLPSYSCIREGPDHAPRFKATVTFNGEIFESPDYHSTLRQAEHAAAEVALNTLSKRGPTQSLAARILDETGVCKNLLQETAQRAGVSLPVYTTIRTGPKHLPLFKCVVQVGGGTSLENRRRQRSKLRRMQLWQLVSSTSQTPLIQDSHESEDAPLDRSSVSSKFGRDERGKFINSSSQAQCGSLRTRARTVNVRDTNRIARDGYSSSGRFYSGAPTASASTLNHERNHNGFLLSQHSPGAGEASYEDGQGHVYNPSPHAVSSQILPDPIFGGSGRGFYKHAATPGSSYCGSSRRQKGRHQRRHSLSGVESPMATHETATTSRASGGGSILGRMMVYHPQQIRGLPYQSLSERFELNRPSLLEELQQRDEEEEWHRGDSIASSIGTQQLPRNRWQSQSERFEYRSYPLPQLEEISGRDEDEWHQIEPLHSSNSSVQRSESSDCSRNYSEGWLRGETLLRRLEDKKRHGYKEGWLLGDVVKDDKKLSFREDWAHNEVLNARLEEDRIQKLNATRGQTHLHGYNDGWFQAEALDSSSEERTSAHGHAYGYQSEMSSAFSTPVASSSTAASAHGHTYNYQSEKNSAYNTPAASSSTVASAHGHAYSYQSENNSAYSSTPAASSPTVTSGSPSHSHFSSLWSKSTNWWGSRSPLSPSSAAAALANSLGLRPPAAMAPAVRVRHMVPVFAAPPRRNEVSGPIQPPRSDQASRMMDGESTTRQLFSKLRM